MTVEVPRYMLLGGDRNDKGEMIPVNTQPIRERRIVKIFTMQYITFGGFRAYGEQTANYKLWQDFIIKFVKP